MVIFSEIILSYFLVKAITDNLDRLEQYIETWNPFKIVWSKVNGDLTRKYENQTDVDLYEILFKS